MKKEELLNMKKSELETKLLQGDEKKKAFEE
jgi:hypothetical protein